MSSDINLVPKLTEKMNDESIELSDEELDAVAGGKIIGPTSLVGSILNHNPQFGNVGGGAGNVALGIEF